MMSSVDQAKAAQDFLRRSFFRFVPIPHPEWTRSLPYFRRLVQWLSGRDWRRGLAGSS